MVIMPTLWQTYYVINDVIIDVNREKQRTFLIMAGKDVS